MDLYPALLLGSIKVSILLQENHDPNLEPAPSKLSFLYLCYVLHNFHSASITARLVSLLCSIFYYLGRYKTCPSTPFWSNFLIMTPVRKIFWNCVFLWCTSPHHMNHKFLMYLFKCIYNFFRELISTANHSKHSYKFMYRYIGTSLCKYHHPETFQTVNLMLYATCLFFVSSIPYPRAWPNHQPNLHTCWKSAFMIISNKNRLSYRDQRLFSYLGCINSSSLGLLVHACLPIINWTCKALARSIPLFWYPFSFQGLIYKISISLRFIQCLNYQDHIELFKHAGDMMASSSSYDFNCS